MLSSPEILIIIIAYTVSVFVSGAVGFGGFLLFFGIVSFINIEPKELLFIATAAGLIKTISSAWLFRADIPWKVVQKIFVFALPMVVIGGLITNSLSPTLLRQFIGVFTISYLAWRVFRSPSKNYTLSKTKQNIWAGSWGFISGLIGAGGPVLVAFLNTLKLKKAAFVATLQTVFIGSLLIKLPLYYPIESGYTKNLPLIVILGIVSIAGSYFGKRINKKIPEKTFEYLVLGLLFITGVKMLIG